MCPSSGARINCGAPIGMFNSIYPFICGFVDITCWGTSIIRVNISWCAFVQMSTVVFMLIWCMCDRASCIKITRGTKLMHQCYLLSYIISTCLWHLCAYLQEHKLFVAQYWCSAISVVAAAPTSRCGKLCSVSKSNILHTVHNTTHRLAGTAATTLIAEHQYAVTYILFSWRWAYKLPKYVEINYDNVSQSLHQVGTSRHFRSHAAWHCRLRYDLE
jgi:hypothetical protein